MRIPIVAAGLVLLAACSAGGGSMPAGPGSAVADGPVADAAGRLAVPGRGVLPLPSGKPIARGPAGIVVHSDRRGAVVSKLLLGANMAAWFDPTQSGMTAPVRAAGITATRWPGGSESDGYHWSNNTVCSGFYTNPNSTFDNFMTSFAQPAGLDVAITVDYGSNAACNGGGDPAEAAAWVAYAKDRNYGVNYWTVGNEEYGSWETDMHASPHDPSTYAASIAGANGYYAQMKAADANAKIGVTVDADASWDSSVLANARYDFVELHYYAQGPGSESDSGLLENGAAGLTSQVQYLQSELARAGKASTPIYVGELGSVYANPGKQAQSIVQALFAGLSIAELAQDGVFRATWWLGYGGCDDASDANFSSSLYGYQNFGGYMIFSDGTPEYGCSNATAVPRGTPLATARAFEVMSQYVRDGEHVLAVSQSSAYPNVRSYASTDGSGYAVALFNLDKNDATTVTIGVDGLASGRSSSIVTYGRAQYDRSASNVWAAPVSHRIGPWHGPVSVSLPAYSMSVLILAP